MAESSVAHRNGLVPALKRKGKGLNLEMSPFCATPEPDRSAALHLDVVIDCAWTGMLTSLMVPLTSSPSGLLVVPVLALRKPLRRSLLRLRFG